MPRHVNPDPLQLKCTAMAPYNFVPLPNEIFAVSEYKLGKQRVKPWQERHDEFIPGTYSGSIELEIETLTPLFIRGPLKKSDNDSWKTKTARHRYQSYQGTDGRPVIPGSSIRGMLRTIVEVISFSKIKPVSTAKPFYRELRGSIGKQYRNFFLDSMGEIRSGIDYQSGNRINKTAQGYRSRIRAGVIRKKANNKYIEALDIARVDHDLLFKIGNHLFSGSSPNLYPHWDLQHKEIHVNIDTKPQNYFFIEKRTKRGGLKHQDLYLNFKKVHDVSMRKKPGYQDGIIVITGHVPYKHMEFIFVKKERRETIIIPDSLWDRFHDDDQITQWQKKAFPKNKPINDARDADGCLGDGEPVFFLTGGEKSEENPDGLVFLGRAQMFRFPYDKTPEDLVPVNLKDNTKLDLAEAMFGFVRNEKSVKGRVFFEDAVAVSGGNNQGWYEKIIVPQILSSPKVTTFQHYLTQNGPGGKDKLTSYLEGDKTTIRGHKFYWHRWDENKKLENVKEPENHDHIRDSLLSGKDEYPSHTIIQPVKEHINFKGRIRFENTTDLELGALMSAIELPEGCAHKLGMGKPLGLGSVKFKATLKIMNHERRYNTWEDDGLVEKSNWEFRRIFEAAMLDHAQKSNETFIEGNDGLQQIARLNSLYLMLQWENRPPLEKTRYMVLSGGDVTRFLMDIRGNEYSKRPVLPTPYWVAQTPEPLSSGDPPSIKE